MKAVVNIGISCYHNNLKKDIIQPIKDREQLEHGRHLWQSQQECVHQKIWFLAFCTSTITTILQ